MKKFHRAAALLLAVLLICNVAMVSVFAEPEANYTPVDEIVYSKGNVNVRTGPGTDYPVITTLRPGQAIRRTGVGDNGWSRVSYKGEPAYMYTELLTTKSSDTTTGTGNTGTDRLVQQMAIANGLEEWNYTRESWEAVADALNAARKLENSKDEAKRDAAAAALEKALSLLVSMDYAALESAISKANERIKSSELYDLVDQLRDAVAEAEQLRFSGDQEQVDATAERIAALLDELAKAQEKNTVIQTVVQEVEVEVPPKDDYCNISMHRIWPVAFAASVVLNLILALVLMLLMKKKRYKAEDVPLVDYDIDDDI